MFWDFLPSSPGYGPESDQGAPRSTAQYEEAVDVAPTMGLPVLLLSPTRADLGSGVGRPRTQGTQRGSHSAILVGHHWRARRRYGRLGKNLRERHRWWWPFGGHRAATLY